MSEDTKITKATIEEASEQIERVASACDIVKLSELPKLEQAITLARGIQAMKRVFTEHLVNEVFMPLQGTSLGFLTDKDRDGGYPSVVVRNCWIQGCIWGLQPVNNELNIIAEKPYAAKNGLERKVRELTQGLIIRPGVPVASGDKTALLPMRATWMRNGKRYDLVKDVTKIDDVPFDERYAIRVNSGMGPDAVIGKGYRKVYRDILAMITNGSVVIPEGDVLDATGETISGPAPAPAAPERDGKRIPVGKFNRDQSTPPMREPGEEG